MDDSAAEDSSGPTQRMPDELGELLVLQKEMSNATEMEQHAGRGLE